MDDLRFIDPTRLARRIACRVLDIDPEAPSAVIDEIFAPGNVRGEFAIQEAEHALGSCWHCGTLLLLPHRPRCEQCPDECDVEGCDEPGCTDPGPTVGASKAPEKPETPPGPKPDQSAASRRESAAHDGGARDLPPHTGGLYIGKDEPDAAFDPPPARPRYAGYCPFCDTDRCEHCLIKDDP